MISFLWYFQVVLLNFRIGRYNNNSKLNCKVQRRCDVCVYVCVCHNTHFFPYREIEKRASDKPYCENKWVFFCRKKNHKNDHRIRNKYRTAFKFLMASLDFVYWFRMSQSRTGICFVYSLQINVDRIKNQFWLLLFFVIQNRTILTFRKRAFSH